MTPDQLAEFRETVQAAADALTEVVDKLDTAASSSTANQERRTVHINVKVSEVLAFALAERAEAEGVSQKQIFMRALAAIGLPVDPLDLEDRITRRRRRPAE